MKAYGMILIFLSSYILSVQIGEYYTKRVSNMQILRDILTDILSQITYAPKDIYSILNTYSSVRYSPFDDLFGRCSDGGDDVIKIMDEGFYVLNAVDERISDIFIQAFSEMMHSSREGAMGHLKVCIGRFDETYHIIKKETDTKNGMYRKLSLFAAAALCITLI